MLKPLPYLIAVLFLASCENNINDVRALDKKGTGQELGIDINAYMSESGRVKAHLTAPLMTRSTTDSSMTEFPKTLKVTLYDDSTKETTHIFAKYGRYVGTKNLIFLKDSVVIYNINKDTLRTSELYWDQNKELMYTDKTVWVHRIWPQAEYIHAKNGMEASSKNLNDYLFKDPQSDSYIQYSEMALGPGGVK